MGVLRNRNHERFCQIAHKRIWEGAKSIDGYRAAYSEAIYEGPRKAGDPIVVGEANIRRLRNRPEIRARLKELAEYAAKIAGLDAGWAQVHLRSMVEANLDDYLGPAGADGVRHFDIGSVSREKLAQLAELSQEQMIERGKRRVRKVRVKLPDKVAALTLLAKMSGWLAPEKREVTGQLTLEQLVAESYKAKES